MASYGGATQGFSPNGQLFAYSSPDGTLKLWDTSTCKLKKEFTPSSHLSASCSCLRWAPSSMTVTPVRKRKKRKSVASNQQAESDFIALGTNSGSILIYNVKKGDLQAQLDNGHTDRVNDICWSSDGLQLFSCSVDGHVVQWSLESGDMQHKWKVDDGGVFAICLCSNERYLLTASHSIKLWDLDNREIKQSFLGHATEVFQLLPVETSGGASEMNGDSDESSYFLSAALNDRLIHAWHVDPKSKSKTSLASFRLPEEAIQVELCRLQGRVVIVSVVTKNGQLLFFEHVLNGHMKKPNKPKVVLQIASEAQLNETPSPIPIIACRLLDNTDSNVLFAHGNFFSPVYERMNYDTLESNMCLVRNDPSKLVSSKVETVTKTKTPEVNSDEMTVLAPGHMAPTAPKMASTEDQPSRRKRKKSVTGELSLDDRLNAISVDNKDKTVTQPPKTDTLATLLAQGLQSNDKKMLNSVLQNRNEKIIKKTLQQLPISCVVPFLKELATRMQGHAQSGQTLVRWMKMVLTVHTSYLTTYPELVDTLGSIYQMMDARVSLFGRLSKLQGRLEVMLSQMTAQTVESDDVLDQQPLLVYQDESSEDEEVHLGDVESESEGHWEDEEMEEDEHLASQTESDDEDSNDGDEDHRNGGGGSDEEMKSDSESSSEE